MPTQEERLTSLEQKTAAHIQEIDENTTIMLGVMRHQGQDIKRIFQQLEIIDENLSTLGRQLNQLDTRLNRLENKVRRTHKSPYPEFLERLQ